MEVSRKVDTLRTAVRIGRAFGLALAAVLVIGAVGLAQTRTSTARTRESVEPTQPAMLMVDGKIIETDALDYKREQVMVWLRELQTLGWGVISSGEGGEVLFQGNGVTLSFAKGQKIAKVNALSVQLSVETYIKNGRLMVPLLFVAKSLDFEYDVSFRPVAAVLTKSGKAAVSANTITGKITYAGKPIQQVSVRIVNPDFSLVKGATGKTDADGAFSIRGLPDGQYMAYVYVGDNPAYFNCKSDPITVRGGASVDAKPMAICRVIDPVSPKSSSKVAPKAGKIELEWQACPQAASYEVSIQRQGARDRLPDITTKKSSASLSAIGLKSGGVYEIEVRALDASRRHIGWTAGSGGKPWSFVYSPAPVVRTGTGGTR